MLKEKKLLNNQGGQALIIILLAMSVVLTVVLSSVSKSITEVKTTSYEEEALRAFSAAEAGVEDKLLNLGTIGVTETKDLTESSAKYEVSVVEKNLTMDGAGKQLVYPSDLSSGETATYYMCPIDENGDFVNDVSKCWAGNWLRVCYGPSAAAPNPAVEVSVYYDESNTHDAVLFNNYENVKVFRYVSDPNGVSRTPGSDTPSSNCEYDDGITVFPYRAEIDTNDDDEVCEDCENPGYVLLVKVRMLYSTSPLGFWSQSSLVPSQGVLISSEGSAGDSTRKVEVYQGLPEPLDLFDVAVYSKSGLSK